MVCTVHCASLERYVASLRSVPCASQPLACDDGSLGPEGTLYLSKVRFQRGEQDGRHFKTAQLLIHAGLISLKEKVRQGDPEAKNQNELSALGVA